MKTLLGLTAVIPIFVCGLTAHTQTMDPENLTILAAEIPLTGSESPVSIGVTWEGDLFLFRAVNGVIVWKMPFPAEEPVNPAKIVPQLNDYGYFLQENKNHIKAVPVFEQVIKLEPGRVVTYLNLADSYWETGRKELAVEHYQTYRTIMIAAKKEQRIPARVKQRIR